MAGVIAWRHLCGQMALKSQLTCSAMKEFSIRQVKLYTCVQTQKLNYKLTNFCSNDNAFFFFSDNVQIGFTANQETFPIQPAASVRSSGRLINSLLCVM
jgi:hypothetical protein